MIAQQNRLRVQGCKMADSTAETTFRVTVPEEKAGERLDRFLAGAGPDLSRTRLKKLIEEGQVEAETGAGRAGTASGPVRDPARKVRLGESFILTIPETRPATPEPQKMALVILYEDADVIVVDKPAGLVVHPAPGNPDRTLVNALLAHCRGSLSGIGGVARPGIVHRLDKDTSGLMVVAKNDAAHRGLVDQFADRSLHRAYKALVWGVPSPRAGEISGPIGRSPRNRKKMAVLSRGGRSAETHYRVLKALGTRASLIECRLVTGRTHQIRVHMASVGHPVIGDPLYGRTGPARLGGLSAEDKRAITDQNTQALHAYSLEFVHPRSLKSMMFESQVPLFFHGLTMILGKL